MRRRIIIEGNAVYEIDEECMKKRKEKDSKEKKDERKKRTK